MRTERPTFLLQAYWSAVICIAIFTAGYMPESIHGKVIAMGVVWLSCFLIYQRRSIAAGLSTPDSTCPDTLIERLILPVCILVSLGAVYFASEYQVTNILVTAVACAVAVVATERSHDVSDRDVNTTQLGLFHGAPPIVLLALTGAYFAGVSVWFVIGFGALTCFVHMIYGYRLDCVEAKPSNVVPLHAVEETTNAS